MARMSATLSRLARTGARGIRTHGTAPICAAQAAFPKSQPFNSRLTIRSSFSTSCSLAKPLRPEDLKTAQPASITEAEFHALSDQYIDTLLTEYEKMQDDRTDLDVEYSAGVMNLTINDLGTYVINKQPPNKQIWLSSPTSGPKRYDWVVTSEGQGQKQDTAVGDWIYLRDGSSLSELLCEETGVQFRDSLGDAT